MKKAEVKRHVPHRTCIGCKEVIDKRALLRIVKTENGLVLDRSGKIAGRGAYLHDVRLCWERAINRGLLAKSLKTTLSEMDIKNLKDWMNELPESEVRKE